MLLLVVIIVALTFATVSCYREFHCTFDNAKFHLPLKSGSYVWGDNVTALEFNSKDELIWIQGRFDEFRSEFYEKIIFSNFKAYMTTYLEMYHVLGAANINDKDKIRSFAAVYEPKLSNKLIESDFNNSNFLALLMKFLRHLSQNFKKYCVKAASDWSFSGEKVARVKNLLSKIEEHYFIAVGGMALDIENIKRSQIEFPAELEKEYLVGIIKISVSGTLGYMIIDVEHPDQVTQVVMDDLSRTFGEILIENSNEPSSRYKLIGRNKNFIQVKRSDVIFVGRPLCSLVATHNRILLLTDILSYLKYNPKFYPTVTRAHVFARLRPERKSERFNLGFSYEDEDGNLNFQEIRFDYMSDVNATEEMEVFTTAQEVFGLKNGILQWQISTMQTFMDRYFP